MGFSSSNRFLSQLATILLSLVFLLCFFTGSAQAQTSWTPNPQPQLLTSEQAKYYPDLKNWTPPANTPHVLLVAIPKISWVEAQKALGDYPHIQKIFAAGRFAQLDTNHRFSCLPGLWWQIGQADSSPWDCQSENSANSNYLPSLLQAFGLKTKAFGPGAHFLTEYSVEPAQSSIESTNQPTEQKSLSLKQWLKQQTASDPKIGSKQWQSQILESTKQQDLTVVDLNLNAGIDGQSVTSIPTPQTWQEQQSQAWKPLNQLLSQLDPQTRVIIFSSNLEVDQPGIIASYSPSQESGLLLSNRSNTIGFVNSIDLNGEIIGQLGLPVRQSPAPSSFLTAQISAQLTQHTSIVNTIDSPDSQLDFQLRSNFLTQQIKLVNQTTGYHYLFWFIPILLLVIVFGAFLRSWKDNRNTWIFLVLLWLLLLPGTRFLVVEKFLSNYPGLFVEHPFRNIWLSSLLCACLLTGLTLSLVRLWSWLRIWQPKKRGKTGKIFSLLASVLVLGGFSFQVLTGPGFTGAPANSQMQSLTTKTPVVVVFTEGLQWSDLNSSPVAHRLDAFLKKAATFSFIPINQRTAPCPQDVWLTLSAGTRPAQNSLGGSNLCAQTPQPEVVEQLKSKQKPLPFWDYYQTMSKDYGLRSPLGTLGQLVSDSGLTQASIGDGAIWGTINQAGIAQGSSQTWPTSDQDLTNLVKQTVTNHDLTLIAATGSMEQVNQNPERIIAEVKHQKYALRKALEQVDKHASINGHAISQDWTTDTAFLIPGRIDAQTLQLLELSATAQHSAETDPEAPLVDLGTAPEAASQAKQIIDSELPTHTQISVTKLSQLLTADPKKYHSQLLGWLTKYQQYLPDQTIVEPKTEAEIKRNYQHYLNSQIARLAKVLESIPGQTRVIVVSASSGRLPQGQQLGFAYGPGIKQGTAYSSSVRHQGLVQAADLTPTVLNWLGLNQTAKTLNLNGSNLRFSTSTSPSTPPLPNRQDQVSLVSIAKWANQADRAAGALATGSSYYYLTSQLVVGFGLLGLVLLNAGFWRGIGNFLAKRKTLSPRTYRIPVNSWLSAPWPGQKYVLYFMELCFVYLAALPLAGFLASCFNWWQDPNPTKSFLGLALGLAGGLTLWAVCGPWRIFRFGPALFLATLNIWFYGLDIVAGSRIIQDSPVGFLTLIGGRFYGMGNEGYSLLATSLLMLLSYFGVLAFQFLPNSKRPYLFRWLINLVIIGVGFGFIFLDGAPNLGADFGGPVSFLPGLAILLLLLNQWRISWIKILLVGVVTVGASALLCIADFLRPPQSRTHLGRFVQSILDGQLGQVLWQKGSGNLATLLVSPHRETVIITFIIALVIWRYVTASPLPTTSLEPFAPTSTDGWSLGREEPTDKSAKLVTIWHRITAIPPLLTDWLDRNYGWLRPKPGQNSWFILFPALKVMLAAVITCQIFAFLLNDSGINLTGLACQAFFFPLLAAGLAQKAD